MFHGLRLTQEFHEQSPQSALLSGVPWERPQSTRIPPLYRKRLTYLRIFFEIIGLHDQKFNTLNMYVWKYVCVRFFPSHHDMVSVCLFFSIVQSDHLKQSSPFICMSTHPPPIYVTLVKISVSDSVQIMGSRVWGGSRRAQRVSRARDVTALTHTTALTHDNPLVLLLLHNVLFPPSASVFVLLYQ